jgi:hypothetical protein
MTGWGGQLGGIATREPIPAFGPPTIGGMLLEQLDVATFILHEESQEVDWLRLSIATTN